MECVEFLFFRDIDSYDKDSDTWKNENKL
jgi:hypothetical protein